VIGHHQKSVIPRSAAGVFQSKFSAVALPLLFSLLIIGCGSGPGAGDGGGSGESDTFTLTGPVKADSTSAKGQHGGCQWTPALFELRLTSAQMQNSVQVKFDVTLGIGGLGDPDAATPAAADGSTPVQLVVAGKAIKAESGAVHVTSADLGAKSWKGTIDTTFTDGTHLTGGWSCEAG
jgi:hypothetical protein